MTGPVRRLLQIFIVLCHVYLLAHSQEPLRMNVGDPWSDANVLTSINYVRDYGFLETSFTDILDVGPLTKDSYRYIHYPPLAEITYGAVAKYLGVSRIETFRLFAIAFSALAMWFLFQYVRRMYDEPVALIATALWSGSLLWMLYADSMHQAPVFQLATYVGLWGLERAIATRRRRYYAAAFLGAFASFLTSYDGWLYLPAAVLITVRAKSGAPLARHNLHFVAVCAAGCVLAIIVKSLFVIGAVGWHDFVADLHLQFLERSTSTYDRGFQSATPAVVRRLMMGFSPLIWVAIAVHAIQAIRARSLRSVLDDTAIWMLLCALAFFYVFAQLAASQWLPSQVMLPFWAIGSACIIARLIAGRLLARLAGYAWMIGAAVWTGYFLFTLERSLLPPGDVERTAAYLAANDHNDYLLNNLSSDGIIQANWGRHSLSAPESSDNHDSLLYMLQIFEQTRTDSAHLLMFKRPGSRAIDKTLWWMSLRPRQWSVAAMSMVWRSKTRRMITERDARVRDSLAACGAVKLFEGKEFDLYRIDRATVEARVYAAVPPARFLDPAGPSGRPHLMLGWWPRGNDGTVAWGWVGCPWTDRPCKTVLTSKGIWIPDSTSTHRAELAIRATGNCAIDMRVQLARMGTMRVAVGDFSFNAAPFATEAAFTIPRDKLRPGINKIVFIDRQTGIEWALPPLRGVFVSSIEIDEPCASRD